MINMEHGQWLTLVLLVINSVIDIRKKKISLVSVIICFLFWLIFGMRDCQLLDMVSLIPGVVLLLISLATGGALGMGDAILVAVMGLFCEWNVILWTLVLAFLLSFIWAIGQVCMRTHKKKSFPFVPFILIGYVLVLLV